MCCAIYSLLKILFSWNFQQRSAFSGPFSHCQIFSLSIFRFLVYNHLQHTQFEHICSGLSFLLIKKQKPHDFSFSAVCMSKRTVHFLLEFSISKIILIFNKVRPIVCFVFTNRYCSSIHDFLKMHQNERSKNSYFSAIVKRKRRRRRNEEQSAFLMDNTNTITFSKIIFFAYIQFSISFFRLNA